jgi:hypothetical protein
MAVMKVPKTPTKAFDAQRRPSALLLSQIQHLEWAALPASQRKPGQLPTLKVRTEAQAAERIGQLTAMVLEASKAPKPQAGAIQRTPAPVTLPPIPRAPGSRASSRSASAKKKRAARRPKGKQTAAKRATPSRGRTRSRKRAGR